MRKVITYSLWGDNPIYLQGAIQNVKMGEEFYPGWIHQFHCAEWSVPKGVIQELKDHGAEVELHKTMGDWTSMFWRFIPCSGPVNYVVMPRDCDCRPSKRESEAVEEWLMSEKEFHIMRDHPYHNAPILGGMWGVKAFFLREMEKMVREYSMGSFWQVDQNFLKEKIYPIVKEKSLVHDEFFSFNCPFPSVRKDKFFVGQAFDENNKPLNPEHMEILG